MKDQNMEGHDENQDPSMEQLLTAYLLGECDEATAARVEAALADDDLLRARRVAQEEVLGLLRNSAPEAPASLAPERRDALRVAAQAAASSATTPEASPGTNHSSPWWQAPVWRMAAGLVIFGGAVALWQPWNSGTSSLRPGLQASAPSHTELGELGYQAASPESTVKINELGYADLSQLGYSGGGGDRGGAPAEAKPNDSTIGLAFDAVGTDKSQDWAGYIAQDPAVGSYDWTQGGGAADDVRARLQVAEQAPERLRGLAGGKDLGLGGGLVESEEPTQTLDQLVAPTLAPSSPGAPASSRSPEVLRFAAEEQDQKEGLGRFGKDNGDLDLDASLADVGLFALGYVDEESLERKALKHRGVHVVDGYGRTYYNTQILEHLHRQERERPSDMFFRYYGDNAAVLATTNPLSTFAADVDSASYALSRAYLVDGHVPPKAAVRTEEFLNYFDYDLPVPTEDDFAVYLEGAPSVFSHEPRQLLGIGIQAKEIAADARPAMNLVFVIDKSGSMEGERMQLVKDALELVIDQLKEDDTLGLVTFDSRGHVLQESISVRERYKLRRAVRNLTTGGSTNAGEGLALGYEMIEKVFDPKRINRVILASDGVANTGESDQTRILAQVKARAEAEVDLTTLGVGMGNHNDVFLEQLADHGDGSCHYLDDFAEAKRVLVDDFLGTLVTVGRQLKIQVEFDPQSVQRWRQLGYENRSLTAAQFRDDAVDAGEVGSGQDVVALYELTLMPEVTAETTLATVRLRWIPEGASAAVERSFPMTVGQLTGRWGLASKRLRLAAVSAQLAETLRQSWHARGDDRDLLASEAARLAEEWSAQPEVGELREMIRRTHGLLPPHLPGDELTQLMEEARWMHLRQAEIEQLQQGQEDQEELLEILRLQNAALEARLQELLQGR